MPPCTFFYKLFVWTYIFSSLGYIPLSGITGSCGSSTFNILGNCKLFTTAVVLFNIPTSNVGEFQLLLLNLRVAKGEWERTAQRWSGENTPVLLKHRRDWWWPTSVPCPLISLVPHSHPSWLANSAAGGQGASPRHGLRSAAAFFSLPSTEQRCFC